MAFSVSVSDVAVVLTGLLVLNLFLLRSKRRATLPPGPKGLPIFGNVLDMPKIHEWRKFSEWNDQYGGQTRYTSPCISRFSILMLPLGDMFSLNLLGQPVIVLGSVKHCVALLDKRSSIYSDRPRLVMAGELVGYNKVLAMMPYGDMFREFRRMSHKVFGTRAQIAKYNGLEEYETKKWLRHVMNDPDNVAKHIRKYVSRPFFLRCDSVSLEYSPGWQALSSCS